MLGIPQQVFVFDVRGYPYRTMRLRPPSLSSLSLSLLLLLLLLSLPLSPLLLLFY
jgi:hypothetical protein